MSSEDSEAWEDGTSTACVLLIGNEILSGKTQDVNLQYIGTELSKLGVKLAEARVLPDEVQAIVDTVNECRGRYDYVFTTGGIGPTHDDITAKCIAKAFGRKLILDERAVKSLKRGKFELNEARLKMARIPEGAELIENSLSHAPGFRVENVHVLAGVPSIARAMFETLAQNFESGPPIYSRDFDVFLREGDIAGPLEVIADEFPEIDIGSYPFARDGHFGANLVVRGTDVDQIEEVLGRIIEAMTALGDESTVGEPG
mgnify:CR=1 FL=1